MEIDFIKVRKDARSTPLINDSFLANRIGFWANVCDVDSVTNTVSVISDTGIKYSGLPVVSKEWVNKVDTNDFVSGSRNLPQIGTHVFVLAPTHTATGAFVLCSGYSRGDTSKQTLFSSKDDKDKKNDIEESVNQAGWKRKVYYKNGNTIFENKTGTIHIEINSETDNDDSLDKRVYIEAFGHSILIEENGIEIYNDKDDKTKNYIKMNNGIELKGNSGKLEIL